MPRLLRSSSPPSAPLALALGLSLALVVTAGCRGDRTAQAPAPAAPARAATAFPCVHFDALRQLLPAAPRGYAHLREEGSSGRYGEISISEAERVFEGEDGQELSVRIVDTTLSEELARAIRAAANDASHREEGAPTAPILREGAVGFVRFDPGAQKAEANVLVADRFVVAVVSHGVDGTADVRRLAGSIDFDGLALLR